MKTKKRHHAVPQFYLRRFATPEDQIWVYDKVTGDTHCTSITNASVETHLYSVTLDDGTHMTDVEDFLAKIESSAAPVLAAFMDGRPIEGQDRMNMASFIAMMYVRTHAFRRCYAEGFVKMMQTTLYSIARDDRAFESQTRRYEKAHGSLTNEEKQALHEGMLNPSKFKVIVNRDWTLRALTVHDALAPIVNKMHWSLLYVPGPHYLVTGDNPVTQNVPTQYKHPIYGGGFLDQHSEAVMPLSPRHCWLGHWKTGVASRAIIPSQVARLLNRNQAVTAERFLFGPRQDSGIQALAKKYRDSKPGVQVSGFGPLSYSPVSVSRS